ncbi:hypothetical protein GC197_08505 [bacterium]|nr:hypothetical protein [bacterium]
MIARTLAAVAVAAIVGCSFVSTAEAGLFSGRAAYPYHHAPRVEYRIYNRFPHYQVLPTMPVLRHVNDPSLYRDETGYGES